MNYRDGVLLAHRPGRNTIKRDLSRLVRRCYFFLIFRDMIPVWLREKLLLLTFRLNPIIGGSKGNTLENDILKLVFNATAIANIADNAATSPLTNLYASLHTGDPGEAGDQTTSEIAYTGYARVAVARTTGGWTVTTNSVSPVANIEFGAMTGGAGGTVTHSIVGTASTGTGKLLYSGAVTPNISVTSGVTPRLTTASTVTED